MVHIQAPDRFNGFRWVAYVEDRHGATTASRDFETEAEAETQAGIWQAEMDRTNVVIGATAASYEG